MPSGGTNHLFVIVADAFVGQSHQTHLLVNFSSIKEGVYHDPACVVPAGCHPKIVGPSFVAYQFAYIDMAADLIRGVKKGTYAPDQPVTMQLLAAIRNGIATSVHVPKKCRTYLEKNP